MALAFILIAVLIGAVAASIYFATRSSRPTFTLSLYPSQLRGDAIAGQLVVLLVTVASNASSQIEGGAVFMLSAVAGGLPVSVRPQIVTSGQVAEVTIIPTIESVGNNLTVAVTAEGDGQGQTKSMTFAVVPGENQVGNHAMTLRDRFVLWLQANQPELGITNQTEWAGTVVSPRWLTVTHYLFFSRYWEMHVYWHIMIPPYDWARIDLRQRTSGLTPSLSFEISSLNASLPPQSIATASATWR